MAEFALGVMVGMLICVLIEWKLSRKVNEAAQELADQQQEAIGTPPYEMGAPPKKNKTRTMWGD